MGLPELTAGIEALKEERRRPNFGNAGAVNNLLATAAMRMEARTKHLSPQQRSNAVPVPEDFYAPQVADPARIFDNLIGCKAVLEKLREWQATIQACQRLGKDPLETFELNFLFVGSPGECGT